MASDKGGITFKVLYKKWIDQVINATSRENLLIDSSAMRDEAENQYVGLLHLEGIYLKAWKDYYSVQKGKRQRGEAIDKSKGEIGEASLDRNNEAVINKGLITIKQARALKLALLNDMGEDPKNIEIGHDDHGVAMDKAKILYDNAIIVDEVGGSKNDIYGITREQKAYIGKALVAQQAIERAKHSDIVRIKKKLGAEKVNDEVLMAYLNQVNEKIELNANFLMQTGIDGPKLNYDLKFQAKVENQEAGLLTSALGTRIQKMLESVDDEAMKTFKDSNFAWTLINVPGSDTMLQRVGKFITNIILGRRNQVPPSKKSEQYKVENKRSTKLKAAIIKVKKLKREAIARIRRTKIEEPKVPLVGIFNVMGLINLVLAREIEAQMGKSHDPPTRLRYQTGRFADSAKLIALKESRGGQKLGHANTTPLVGIYTYLHYPYDVFLPGHPLDNGLRDPTIYIEHGIRAAARTILEDRYPGMILEPD